VDVQDAVITVEASGVRYRNGTAAFELSRDRVTVSRFHVEYPGGRGQDVSGRLGTHELRVGDLEIDARAARFTVLDNEFGTIDVNADLRLRGQFERPRIIGAVTVVSGELSVDAILDRTLFRPYATEAATATPDVDALAALNLWDRLGLDIELHVPDTLRMTGDAVQVAAGTPLGLSSFNLRVLGDLYLYKDPGQPLYPTGSFDSVTGSYAFQGKRFDLDPTSSIDFHGEPVPEVYVTVFREISGVEARVTIAGSLREPELRLASTPPLEASDILSLIVFNASTNELSSEQQRELAYRGAALAAGFLTSPLVSALQRSIGLDTLELDAPMTLGGGPRVTIGAELAPRLVARFSRQFGAYEYAEATVEYHLSRILRVRATFSDAASLSARAGWRRVERAGIDFLIFFSF
jgi:autotransporter translocation and assembly factor TamB